MSRKVQMRRIWRAGDRRSPRISALEAWKARLQPTRPPFTKTNRTSTTNTNTNSSLINSNLRYRQPPGAIEGPASRTRAKKRRKLRPLLDVSSSTSKAAQDSKKNDEQDRRQPSDNDPLIHSNQSILNDLSEDQAAYPDQSSRTSFASWMPEKRILELVIDLLQRRDTREIFAEPVDPSEVESYYEIIKEPMDFGTMRAKLHEGMYITLEQFEHDVFLITRNAMHFNSSATVYFRQALAIDKLAKKIFDLLRTDPENFEFKFLETRRRSSRRLRGKGRCFTHNSVGNLATNSNSNDMRLGVMTELDPSSTKSSSNLKRAVQEKIGCYGVNIISDRQDRELFHADRRSSYKLRDPLLSMYHPIVGSSKELMLVMQQDICYRESLKLFVKDLGPTAQMIAKQKLNGWSTDAEDFPTLGSDYCQNVAASTCARLMPTALKTAKFDADCNKVGIHDTSVRIMANRNDKITLCSTRGEARDGVTGTPSNQTSQQNQKKDLNFSTSGLNETDKVSSLGSEKNKTDTKMPSAEIHSVLPSSWPQTLVGQSSSRQVTDQSQNLNCQYHESNGQAIATVPPRQELGTMSETGQALKLTSSPFIFDLPFVKSRLVQTNLMGRGICFQQSNKSTEAYL
ncbi:hypothetical protein K2173_008210 [Erythroxylum novogranatense]|uniref:Bromo domain-containing protein n=1 Tax=Erythroxylum novogranatense TaxID=1862640 RepID=A0AAV8UDN7_9ROSI|nr:hypothetical protein K2173_008210 [Erythroxylum novogranatense]